MRKMSTEQKLDGFRKWADKCGLKLKHLDEWRKAIEQSWVQSPSRKSRVGGGKHDKLDE